MSLLVMIAVTAATGAWLSWRALKDQQVQLEGQSASQSEAVGEHDLETDLTKRESPDLGKPPAASGTAGRSAPAEGAAGSRRAAPSLQTSMPTTVDGTVVAGVVTVVLLGAAAAAARLVLGHYRRQRVEGAQTAEDDWGFVDRVGDEPAADTSEVDPDGRAVSQDAELHLQTQESQQSGVPEEGQHPPVTEPAELHRTGLDAVGSEPGLGQLPAERAPAALAAEPLEADRLVPAQRSSAWDARQEAPVDGSPWLLDSPLGPESPSYDAAAQEAASENIFDRRTARRVPYVHSAWLWWGEANGPAMVQDLSASGLRVRFSISGATPPGLGESLRIFFPVSGTTVKSQARVQWRRTVDGATEVGVHFLDLPAGDQELIEAVLLAAQ